MIDVRAIKTEVDNDYEETASSFFESSDVPVGNIPFISDDQYPSTSSAETTCTKSLAPMSAVSLRSQIKGPSTRIQISTGNGKTMNFIGIRADQSRVRTRCSPVFWKRDTPDKGDGQIKSEQPRRDNVTLPTTHNENLSEIPIPLVEDGRVQCVFCHLLAPVENCTLVRTLTKAILIDNFLKHNTVNFIQKFISDGAYYICRRHVSYQIAGDPKKVYDQSTRMCCFCNSVQSTKNLIVTVSMQRAKAYEHLLRTRTGQLTSKLAKLRAIFICRLHFAVVRTRPKKEDTSIAHTMFKSFSERDHYEEHENGDIRIVPSTSESSYEPIANVRKSLLNKVTNDGAKKIREVKLEPKRMQIIRPLGLHMGRKMYKISAQNSVQPIRSQLPIKVKTGPLSKILRKADHSYTGSQDSTFSISTLAAKDIRPFRDFQKRQIRVRQKAELQKEIHLRSTTTHSVVLSKLKRSLDVTAAKSTRFSKCEFCRKLVQNLYLNGKSTLIRFFSKDVAQQRMRELGTARLLDDNRCGGYFFCASHFDEVNKGIVQQAHRFSITGGQLIKFVDAFNMVTEEIISHDHNYDEANFKRTIGNPKILLPQETLDFIDQEMQLDFHRHSYMNENDEDFNWLDEEKMMRQMKMQAKSAKHQIKDEQRRNEKIGDWFKYTAGSTKHPRNSQSETHSCHNGVCGMKPVKQEVVDSLSEPDILPSSSLFIKEEVSMEIDYG